MKNEKKAYWNLYARLCLSSGKGKVLQAYFGGPKEIVTAGKKAKEEFFSLAGSLKFSEEEKKRWEEIGKLDALEELEALCAHGISFVTREEEDYPKALAACPDAPEYLYYKGKLPQKEELLISVVGARKCSPYGAETAKILAQKLCAAGIGIVSGLALGVDGAAHEGALLAKGKTYAVLGCGVEQCYPPANRGIYEAVLAGGGGILSEYPPNTPPLPCFFPQRNRIIAGLSEGIIVTEARKRSGSLITVSLGLDYGRNIYAVPGRVTDVLSEGCNYLIREGAKPVLSTEDVLADFQGRISAAGRKKKEEKNKKNKKIENMLASDEKIVYANLRLSLQHIEDLQKATGMSPARLSGCLEALLEQGCIKRYGQAYYALTGKYEAER